MAKDNVSQLVEKLKFAHKAIKEQLAKIIVGQDEVIEQILIALFTRGHCLIVGVPGLAKTLLVSTISKILGLQFSRIQFTPDLMPADITGTEIIQEDPQTSQKIFKFIKGPIFTQTLLADEINRTPPKTQSALLEVMQEFRVTAAGKTYDLDPPFFVLATQNPIEQEGTYPLPEAQLDRFFFQVNISYPSKEEEKIIVERTTSTIEYDVQKLLNAREIIALQQIVRDVPVSDHILDTVVNLVRSTRPDDPRSDEIAKKYIRWGAGPRASQTIVLAGKANAILSGRYTITTEDISRVIHPALRHRIILNYSAEAEGINTDTVIDMLWQKF